MKSSLTFEVVQEGQIEQCRDLCNELMAFQKSQAIIAPEVFDRMNFDTRMKRSYDSALRSQVIVVKDDGVPVGYIFSTVETVKQGEDAIPAWAPVQEGQEVQGFYPNGDELPPVMGCVSNLYVREAYKGMGLGSKLFGMAMEWLESFEDVDLIMIYISNGNEAALDFYLSRGFTFSHEVFGGFIKAVYKRLK
ncbi:acetyltransferase (GNAT) family protein [Paenibacillus taihuensis]|uniref:Acetyltransferase (GNAT) family protein n=1 Tax=Paenibacillus taihuensis TaxID=1156355 RepID=A0A3D9S240_9BACL|nr:GNAT family N-acetyltransferase [Paenibacillus taihuensis]REE83954.1 acetyltransferase (GNAT) family protein [Paenibacillus taihuensis]